MFGSLFLLTLILAIDGGGVDPSWGQTRYRAQVTPERSKYDTSPDRRGELRGREGRGAVEQLPDWAESRVPSSKENAGVSTSQFGTHDHGSGHPPPKPEVPVDGGLIWLVLVGIGYGVFRLRSY